jgi:hypothetical protein
MQNYNAVLVDNVREYGAENNKVFDDRERERERERQRGNNRNLQKTD